MVDLATGHGPNRKALIRTWHYTAPAVVVLLAGRPDLSSWRVWLPPWVAARGLVDGRTPLAMPVASDSIL